MKKRISERTQKGFMLVGVAIAAVVLLILAFAIVRYGQVDSDSVMRSKVNANLQAALDAGTERALAILNTGNNWNTPTSLAGFQSLSVTAYTEMARTEYWVMIVAGSKNVTFSAKFLDDSAAMKLTNTGDINLDRTIFIRAVDTLTSRTATAQAIIHRNTKLDPTIIGGVTTSGTSEFGNNETFQSFNSCEPGGGTVGCSGTVLAGVSASGGTTGVCPVPNQTATTPLVIPTVVIPVDVSPASGSSVTNDISGTMTLYAGSYQCRNLSIGGSNILSLNTCGGPVKIYVTGSVTIAGNCWVLSGCPPEEVGSNNKLVDGVGTPGGTPAKAFIFVQGNGAVTVSGGNMIEVVIYAPESYLDFNGGGNTPYYGALVGAKYKGPNSNVPFHFDACLLAHGAADQYSSPPVVTSSWKIIP